MTLYNILCLLGIPALTGGLTAFLISRVKKLSAENRAIKAGMQAMLRDRLYAIFSACQARGSAGINDRNNFEQLYRQYHALGANGVMTDIHDRFMALDVKGD